MGDEAGGAAIENGEVVLQAPGDIIGVKDGVLGRLGQPGPTHRGNIDPRDYEDAGAAPGRGSYGADRVFAAEIDDPVPRQELH